MYKLFFCGMLGCALLMPALNSAAQSSELYTATPVVDRSLLLIASSAPGGQQGHLRGFDVSRLADGPLWDAAQHIPRPGIGAAPGSQPDSDPPQDPDLANLYRSLYTSLPGRTDRPGLIPLTVQSAELLQPALAVADRSRAEMLINLARGRQGCTEDRPAGIADRPWRLWGIRRSRPVPVGYSPVMAASGTRRDRVVYLGAADGMLHAFHAGSWDEEDQSYRNHEPAAGTELWAYLPGSLLPALQEQPFADSSRAPVIEVDSEPAVGDFFIDLDGDGQRRWHTLLAATASAATHQHSGLFVLDVTDPYRPQLLWEKPLTALGMGAARGVRFGLDETGLPGNPQLFLSSAFPADSAAEIGSGLKIQALDALRGLPLWQFSAPYTELDTQLSAAPPVPSLLDSDSDGRVDWLVCGDLAGRLWALAAADGAAFGDAPLFVTPGGYAEPIGAGAALHGQTILFGTGGAEHADPAGSYAIYAVDLTEAGAQLLWQVQLRPGEQVWQTPLVDQAGNLLLGVAEGYQGQWSAPATPTSGRLLVIGSNGENSLETDLPSGLVARTLAANGRILAVSLNGEVRQFGSPEPLEPATPAGPGSVRVLSWRLR